MNHGKRLRWLDCDPFDYRIWDIDKPTIQYIVEEAAASGIEEILIVTSNSKNSIMENLLIRKHRGEQQKSTDHLIDTNG